MTGLRCFDPLCQLDLPKMPVYLTEHGDNGAVWVHAFCSRACADQPWPMSESTQEEIAAFNALTITPG